MSDGHRSIGILVPRNSVCYSIRYFTTNLVQEVTVDDVGRVKRLESCSAICSVTLVRVLTWDNAGTRRTPMPTFISLGVPGSHNLNTYLETIRRQKKIKMPTRKLASNVNSDEILLECGTNFSTTVCVSQPLTSILKPDMSTVWFSLRDLLGLLR